MKTKIHVQNLSDKVNLMKSMFFNFALDYASRNGDLKEDFIVDEKIISK